MSRVLARTAMCLLLASTLLGCVPTQKVEHTKVYTGPILPLDQLLFAINQNNARITTLNASGNFLLSVPKQTPLNGQLTLLFTKPDQVRVFGNKDLAGRIFDLGTDGKKFWMVAKGDQSTTWFGTNMGPAETNKDVPISPQLLADVLGVATMNLDLLAQPIPTVRFNPDYDCYMLTWHQPLKDRWVTLREIWYDRSSFEPRRIWLFDRDGKVVLRAKLSQFEPMRVKSDDTQTPRTARSFELFFPESSAQFTFSLDSVRDVRNGVPNNISYRFDPNAAGTDKIINLDELEGPK